MVFVFGSNLKGIHGGGAALFAYKHRGARWGMGEGFSVNSYAIPTCSEPGVPLPLSEISTSVSLFLGYAMLNSEKDFQVTAIGCGLAGYKPEQIAPFFAYVTDNVWLPGQFTRVLYELR